MDDVRLRLIKDLGGKYYSDTDRIRFWHNGEAWISKPVKGATVRQINQMYHTSKQTIRARLRRKKIRKQLQKEGRYRPPGRLGEIGEAVRQLYRIVEDDEV